MKVKEKEEARKLRKEKGWSLNKICKHLNVSKGSVSLWVRDIELTKKQSKELYKNHGGKEGSLANKESGLKKRLEYQEFGRKIIKDGKYDLDFIAGLSLYWAEGAKSRNSCRFGTMDRHMNLFFIDFLKKYFNVKNEDICLTIHTSIENGKSEDFYKKEWLKYLKLPKECLRKTVFDYRERNSKYDREDYIGVANIVINKTEIVQKIFGAIQEHFGFERERWIL